MLWRRMLKSAAPDPLNWSGRPMVNTAQWTGVSFGGGEYVTVSRFGGLSQVYSSGAWQSLFGLVSPANPFLSGTFGSGLHVFVGANQEYATRPTGGSWATRAFTPSEAGELSDITYGGGRFVAVDSDLTPKILWSSNGTVWNIASSAGVRAAAVSYDGATRFLGLAKNGQTITSTDGGATWSVQGTISGASNWVSVAYGAGKYVAISSDTSSVATTTDGAAWSLSAGALPAGVIWRKIKYGGGFFCAIGQGTNIAMLSPDGVNWSPSYLPFVSDWWDLGYGDDGFMAVLNGGSTSAILQVP